eukprot:6189652-Pleurochrysis_carterae.AAC.2
MNLRLPSFQAGVSERPKRRTWQASGVGVAAMRQGESRADSAHTTAHQQVSFRRLWSAVATRRPDILLLHMK